MSETRAAEIVGGATQRLPDAATTARRPLAVALDVALIVPMAITFLGLLLWGAIGLLYASAPLWTQVPGSGGNTTGALWLAAAVVVLTVSLTATAVPIVAYIGWVARAHQGLTELRSPGMRLAHIPVATERWGAVPAPGPASAATGPGDVPGRPYVARLVDGLLLFAALGWPAFAACTVIETMLNGLGVRGMYALETPVAMFGLLIVGIAAFFLAWAAWVRLTWLRHHGADGGITIGCRTVGIGIEPNGTAASRHYGGGARARRALAVAVVLLIASSALPWTAVATFMGASLR